MHDIAELQDLCLAPTDAVVRCSYQQDKYSPITPVPQTSVMWIDCVKAKNEWGFHLSKIIKKAVKWNKKEYGAFMHGTWMSPLPGVLPVAWNHLNILHPNKTRLLHYTKEPDQPWYKPDHPFAQVWKDELRSALEAGYIAKSDVEESLSKWGVKEDWRPTNGLHPAYREFLKYAVK